MFNEGDYDDELNKNLAVYGSFAKKFEKCHSAGAKIDDKVSSSHQTHYQVPMNVHDLISYLIKSTHIDIQYMEVYRI